MEDERTPQRGGPQTGAGQHVGSRGRLTGAPGSWPAGTRLFGHVKQAGRQMTRTNPAQSRRVRDTLEPHRRPLGPPRGGGRTRPDAGGSVVMRHLRPPKAASDDIFPSSAAPRSSPGVLRAADLIGRLGWTDPTGAVFRRVAPKAGPDVMSAAFGAWPGARWDEAPGGPPPRGGKTARGREGRPGRGSAPGRGADPRIWPGRRPGPGRREDQRDPTLPAAVGAAGPAGGGRRPWTRRAPSPRPPIPSPMRGGDLRLDGEGLGPGPEEAARRPAVGGGVPGRGRTERGGGRAAERTAEAIEAPGRSPRPPSRAPTAKPRAERRARPPHLLQAAGPGAPPPGGRLATGPLARRGAPPAWSGRRTWDEDRSQAGTGNAPLSHSDLPQHCDHRPAPTRPRQHSPEPPHTSPATPAGPQNYSSPAKTRP